MEIPETDWKQQERHVLDWAAVVTTLLLVGVFLYLGRTRALTSSYAIAAGLLGWLGIYFTDYWEAILYVPVALFLSTVTVFWLIRGTWVDPTHQVAIGLHVLFVGIVAYLLVKEEPVL